MGRLCFETGVSSRYGNKQARPETSQGGRASGAEGGPEQGEGERGVEVCGREPVAGVGAAYGHQRKAVPVPIGTGVAHTTSFAFN
jgi:hypothetical protein